MAVGELKAISSWQTEEGTATPHLIVIDLGSIKTLTGIDWLSRMEQGAPGSVKDYKVYVY